MVYGDSLSAAYGFDPKDGWVAMLAAKLGKDGVTVINSSISGETTSGGLSRIKADLARIRPTIVVLELGANDGLRGLPVADMQRNLQGIITTIQAARARVVLVGVQIPPNYGIEYTQQFREVYAGLAKKNNLLLVPFLLEGFADRLEWFQADRMHPVAEAQPRILENVLPAVRQALKQVQSQAQAPPQVPPQVTPQAPVRPPSKPATTR
jgi:acyl-CoA thioesterase-1